jgi:hypothetical protein
MMLFMDPRLRSPARDLVAAAAVEGEGHAPVVAVLLAIRQPVEPIAAPKARIADPKPFSRKPLV